MDEQEGKTVKHEEKEPITFEVKDPKPPIIHSETQKRSPK